VLDGLVALPEPIPAKELAGSGRQTLRRGKANDGDLVLLVQKKVGATQDRLFGPKTEALVRSFQQQRNLVPDGIVGPATWEEIDKP